MFQRPAPRPNPPVTRDRVEAVLKARDWKYWIDSDGDLGGNWDGNQFFFLFYGKQKEILQVRGWWKHELPGVAEVAATTVANAWNRDMLFPKVYVRVSEDVVRVIGEQSIDLEHGVTDEQLSLFVRSSISTSLQAFERFDEHFRDPVS
ncbi:YbjN domain-containing protein [Xylanimonas allomyrinae]|uniref:YbjN domain-containing protein n=1 Tax=Xylanimonas allomyrinae TaxID=2509459 RepID=A0A4P6ERZ2_9MICO|nr:YbjN domain-containing protein [Xylanimonas allomyrinae]QAY63157.1 YbjN domain-containing protein [Xylanimonas allomyrinae]